ncbi:MAG: hypothetical protein ACRDMH_01385 [Solirubrobacterales bacterium]
MSVRTGMRMDLDRSVASALYLGERSNLRLLFNLDRGPAPGIRVLGSEDPRRAHDEIRPRGLDREKGGSLGRSYGEQLLM